MGLVIAVLCGDVSAQEGAQGLVGSMGNHRHGVACSSRGGLDSGACRRCRRSATGVTVGELPKVNGLRCHSRPMVPYRQLPNEFRKFLIPQKKAIHA